MPVSFRINSLVFDRLTRFAESVNRSRSDVIDRAIEEYLDRHEQHHPPDNQPHQRHQRQ
jgi:predicted transcriptional regulator